MQIFLKKILSIAKEYILLFVLLMISLVVLAANNKPGVKKIRSYAFVSFAVWANILNSTFGSTNKEIEALQIENAKLMLQVNRLKEYAFENAELKSLLAYKISADYRLIPTSIVAKNISKTQGVYIINSGKKDSVKKSMAVLTEKGLVGIVTEVADNYSLIQTLRSSLLRISANIPQSNINGIMSWNGNKLIVNNIPTTSNIQKGDRVVTSTLSTILPPSIPIGLVVKRESNISSLLSKVTIQPFVDVCKIKNVFLLATVRSSQIDTLELNLLSK